MTNSEMLSKKLAAALKSGDVPYRANRRAMRALDVMDDEEKGLPELDLMLVSTNVFVDDLEDVENAARGVVKRSLAAVR